MTRTTLRRVAAGGVALTMTAAALTIGAGPAGAAGGQSHGLGYSVAKTRHADGTWVGRYRVGTQKTYRTEPRAADLESNYYAPRSVTNNLKAGAAATARAAWILSTYGNTRDRSTAAAVDVATYALLHRGKWRLGTAYTRERTRQTGAGPVVRRYARVLLRQSAVHRGPYTRTLSAATVAAGNQTAVTIRVQNRAGHGPVVTSQQQGLAVDVTYPGQGTKTVYLNESGVGTVYFTAAAGSTPIRAVAHRVPDSAMLVRRAHRRAASQLAIAGHARRVAFAGIGVGVTSQVLSVTNSKASSLVGDRLLGTYAVAGLVGSERVNWAVYGPFMSTATGCGGQPAMSGSQDISADGTYTLPAWAPAKTGYYVWGIHAVGNASTQPASACGKPYLVQKTTTTDQTRYGSATSFAVGKAFGPTVTVSGFDRSEAHTVYTRVYGPFVEKANVNCNSRRLFRTLSATATVSGQWHATTVVNAGSNAGYFVFQTTLQPGVFMRSSSSSCGVVLRVTK
jgi:hypothetical protein